MKLPAAFFFLLASLPAAAGQAIYCDPADPEVAMCRKMRHELNLYEMSKDQERRHGGPRATLCDPRRDDYNLCVARRIEALNYWIASRRR